MQDAQGWVRSARSLNTHVRSAGQHSNSWTKDLQTRNMNRQGTSVIDFVLSNARINTEIGYCTTRQNSGVMPDSSEELTMTRTKSTSMDGITDCIVEVVGSLRSCSIM